MSSISKTGAGQALASLPRRSRKQTGLTRMTGIRSVVRWLWIHLLSLSGCFWWAKRSLRRRGATVVLTFHRVLDDFNFRNTGSLPGIVLREETFGDLAKHVSERHEAVDTSKVVPGAISQKLRIAFTFDDGWSDNLTSALPVAGAFQIPFIVFVCPGLAGFHAPFWQEQVISSLKSSSRSVTPAEMNSIIEDLKRSPEDERRQRIAELFQRYGVELESARPFSGDSTLSIGEIVTMHSEGVAIGSHTQTHQLLTRTTPSAARQQIRQSKIAIEKLLGGDCKVFAYPNGNWSPEVKQILAEEGMELAFTTEVGAWTTASDPLAIPRVNVSESNVVGWNGRFSRTMFEYSTIWRAWRGTRR